MKTKYQEYRVQCCSFMQNLVPEKKWKVSKPQNAEPICNQINPNSDAEALIIE